MQPTRERLKVVFLSSSDTKIVGKLPTILTMESNNHTLYRVRFFTICVASQIGKNKQEIVSTTNILIYLVYVFKNRSYGSFQIMDIENLLTCIPFPKQTVSIITNFI